MEDVAARTQGRVAANGIELAYETFGDPGAPPAVLIMGLATQMIAWPDELCEGLARRGLFVVRFGFRRQLAASASQPNRTADLRRITVPTLVIHGLHDPLVAASGGLAVARAIPGSRFVGFSGMGHDLPRVLWPEFVREIAALAAPGEQRSGPGPSAG